MLAGSRGGPDAVADYAGVSHKALIELASETLLARVVGALRGAGAGKIGVVASDPQVRNLAQALGCQVVDPAAGPSESARRGAETMGTPLLVTTADHALLKPEWVTGFLADAPAAADVCVLVAPRAAVERDAPTTQRTWLKFSDGDFSGCNLFWLANDRALGVVDLWRRVEADRKRPWKIAALLGAGVLVRYALGRLTLDQAVARIGGLAGVNAAAVRTSFGLASVDVDKPADLDLVRMLT